MAETTRGEAFDIAMNTLIGEMGGENLFRHGDLTTVCFPTVMAADAAKTIIDGLVGVGWCGEVYGLGRLVVTNPHNHIEPADRCECGHGLDSHHVNGGECECGCKSYELASF